MSIKLDKNTIKFFRNKWSKDILIHFYEAWCSGTKLDITDDFEINDSIIKLKFLPLPKGVPEGRGIMIYVKKSDKEKLENSSITRVVKSDHTWKEKVRYIYSSEKVVDRCGCGSSFNFSEKKKPKINLDKLRNLKNKFNW